MMITGSVPKLTKRLIKATCFLIGSGMFNPSIAQVWRYTPTDPYTVQDIAVDVTAESALQARDIAFSQARHQAFSIVQRRLTTITDPMTVPVDRILGQLIGQFNIQTEQLSQVRYRASVAVTFDRQRLQNYWQRNRVIKLELKPYLIIPIYHDAQGQFLSQPPLAEIWQQTWAQSSLWSNERFEVLVLLPELPSATLEQLVAGDTATLVQVGASYHSEQLVIVHLRESILMPPPSQETPAVSSNSELTTVELDLASSDESLLTSSASSALGADVVDTNLNGDETISSEEATEGTLLNDRGENAAILPGDDLGDTIGQPHESDEPIVQAKLEMVLYQQGVLNERHSGTFTLTAAVRDAPKEVIGEQFMNIARQVSSELLTGQFIRHAGSVRSLSVISYVASTDELSAHEQWGYFYRNLLNLASDRAINWFDVVSLSGKVVQMIIHLPESSFMNHRSVLQQRGLSLRPLPRGWSGDVLQPNHNPEPSWQLCLLSGCADVREIAAAWRVRR